MHKLGFGLISNCFAAELCGRRPSPHPELCSLPDSAQACHDPQQTPGPSQQPPGPHARCSACPSYQPDSAGQHVVPDRPALVSATVIYSGSLGALKSLEELDMAQNTSDLASSSLSSSAVQAAEIGPHLCREFWCMACYPLDLSSFLRWLACMSL